MLCNVAQLYCKTFLNILNTVHFLQDSVWCEEHYYFGYSRNVNVFTSYQLACHWWVLCKVLRKSPSLVGVMRRAVSASPVCCCLLIYQMLISPPAIRNGETYYWWLQGHLPPRWTRGPGVWDWFHPTLQKGEHGAWPGERDGCEVSCPRHLRQRWWVISLITFKICSVEYSWYCSVKTTPDMQMPFCKRQIHCLEQDEAGRWLTTPGFSIFHRNTLCRYHCCLTVYFCAWMSLMLDYFQRPVSS